MSAMRLKTVLSASCGVEAPRKLARHHAKGEAAFSPNLRVSCTQHTPAYVSNASIRQNTPAYDCALSKLASLLHTHNTHPYVYRRNTSQHTSVKLVSAWLCETCAQSHVSHSHTDTQMHSWCNTHTTLARQTGIRTQCVSATQPYYNTHTSLCASLRRTHSCTHVQALTYSPPRARARTHTHTHIHATHALCFQ